MINNKRDALEALDRKKTVQIGIIPKKKPSKYPNAQSGFKQYGDKGYKPSNGNGVGY
jgi:hypothetical protein